jgi:hypothetical protein
MVLQFGFTLAMPTTRNAYHSIGGLPTGLLPERIKAKNYTIDGEAVVPGPRRLVAL